MEGHNLEGARQVLVQEMMKAKPDALLVKKMDVTFALRRQEVVKDKPAINQMVQRWPALFTESQVSMSVFLNTTVNVLLHSLIIMLTSNQMTTCH